MNSDKETIKHKVYSPDITPYSMEGADGVYNTISSILIGPIRLLIRVPHNIMILPANLLDSYATGLLQVGAIMGLLGVIDYIIFHKWPLLVSQIPVLFIAYSMKKKASHAVRKSDELREVDINFQEVKDMCETVYTELDNALGKGDSGNE